MSEDLVLNLSYTDKGPSTPTIPATSSSAVPSSSYQQRQGLPVQFRQHTTTVNTQGFYTVSQPVGATLRRKAVTQGLNIRDNNNKRLHNSNSSYEHNNKKRKILKQKVDDDSLFDKTGPQLQEDIANLVKRAAQLDTATQQTNKTPHKSEPSAWVKQEHQHGRTNRDDHKAKQHRDTHAKTLRANQSDNLPEKLKAPAVEMMQKDTLLKAAVDESLEKSRNKPQQKQGDGLFDKTVSSFDDFGLHPWIVETLKSRMKISTPTKVQSMVIPNLIKKETSVDLLVASQTGSGKTLAYLLPILQRLQEETQNDKDRHLQGTRALIIVPTRELCVQVEEVLRIVAHKFYWIVCGNVMGGEKKKSEKARLRKGTTVLVATPGRLLDHLKTTESFNVSKLNFLIFDEADRLMDLGFEKAIEEIYDILRSKNAEQFASGNVRCVLLSATLQPQVSGFATKVLKDPKYVSITKHASVEKCVRDISPSDIGGTISLPETLQHGLIEVGYDRKFPALLGFFLWKIQSQNDLKAIIFMTSCDEVEFYYSLLLEANFVDQFKGMDLYMLHGNLPQVDRTQIFLRFSSAKAGILLCTNVAARGLDLPEIDWSIQFDPPEDVAEYVHRAGRTARKGKRGRGLLFLSPEKEIGFCKVLSDSGIQLKNVESAPLLQLSHDLIGRCINCIVTDAELEKKANAGFISFVRGYSTYPKHLKQIFHPRNLHLGHVAKSFLLKNPPSTISKVFNRDRVDAQTSKDRGIAKKNHKDHLNAVSGPNKKKHLNLKFDALAEFMC